MVNRNVISEIYNSFFERCTPNLSLMSIIGDEIKKLGESVATPTSYYYLTDLTNPQQKYWRVVTPHIKKNNELKRKLLIGTKLHHKFSQWCKTLPGLMVEEALLDGAYVGIPRVRGKVDCVVDNRIIELKTKEEIPKTMDEIFEKYPQDLEQLVFYSALYPSKPEKNILLFMENKKPYNLQEFEVTTKNFDAIKAIIKDRIKLLDEALSSALDDKAFKKLGRCRYHSEGCEFREAGACRCEKLPPLDLTKFQDSIEIKPSAKFKQQLEQKRKEFYSASSLNIYPNNIIAPRKQFIKNILEIEQAFPGLDEKYLFGACLFSAIAKTSLTQLSTEEKEKLKESVFDKRLNIPFRWLKSKTSSGSTEEILLPYITTISFEDINRGRPSQYHIAELGINCASYNVPKGLIITILPKLNKTINVFEVKYKNSEIKRIQDTVREVINEIESAQKEDDLYMLHACPNFMNREGDCPIQEKCKTTKEYCNP